MNIEAEEWLRRMPMYFGGHSNSWKAHQVQVGVFYNHSLLCRLENLTTSSHKVIQDSSQIPSIIPLDVVNFISLFSVLGRHNSNMEWMPMFVDIFFNTFDILVLFLLCRTSYSILYLFALSRLKN